MPLIRVTSAGESASFRVFDRVVVRITVETFAQNSRVCLHLVEPHLSGLSVKPQMDGLTAKVAPKSPGSVSTGAEPAISPSVENAGALVAGKSRTSKGSGKKKRAMKFESGDNSLKKGRR